MMTNKDEEVDSFLNKTYPNAKCALDFQTPFQAIVAVSLSAQTTDKSVNLVTPDLFKDYPDALAMSKASLEDIENKIKRLGLYHNKAKNLYNMSRFIAKEWNNEIHLDLEELMSLPGVGKKTANVVLAETCARPAIAVDTHVSRVSKRLGYAKESDSPIQIEAKLEKIFPKEMWIPLHHKMIFFGRYMCHAQNPNCCECELKNHCRFYKKYSSKIAK